MANLLQARLCDNSKPTHIHSDGLWWIAGVSTLASITQNWKQIVRMARERTFFTISHTFYSWLPSNNQTNFNQFLTDFSRCPFQTKLRPVYCFATAQIAVQQSTTEFASCRPALVHVGVLTAQVDRSALLTAYRWSVERRIETRRPRKL